MPVFSDQVYANVAPLTLQVGGRITCEPTSNAELAESDNELGAERTTYKERADVYVTLNC